MLKIARNIFVGIFAIILCAVIFTEISERVTTPDVDDKNNNMSFLEGRKYQDMPDLNLDTIMDGTFQSDFEQHVADQVPMRNEILIANATLQRHSIALGADLFGYDVYPTFYSSESCYDEATNSIVEMPYEQSDENTQMLKDTAGWINDFVERHPDTNVTVTFPARLNSSGFSPLTPLLTGQVGPEYLDENFFSQLSDDIASYNLDTDLTPDFTTDYFRTDHHWQADYAYEVYKFLLGNMYPEAQPLEVQEVITWENQPFYGSRARNGLCLDAGADYLKDVVYDESDITVRQGGKNHDLEFVRHREAYAHDEIIQDKYSNKYAEYFHNDYPILGFTNNDIEEGKTLVIVADSFSNTCERFFAENYKYVYVLDPRHYDGTLDEFFEDKNVDDMLFMIHAGTVMDGGFADLLAYEG